MESFANDLESLVDLCKLKEHPRGFALVGASLGGLSILGSSTAKDYAAAIVLVDITPRMEIQGVLRVTSFMKETSKVGFASLEEAAQAIAKYNPSRSSQNDADSAEKSLEGLKKNLKQGPDGRWNWHWDPRFMEHSRKCFLLLSSLVTSFCRLCTYRF